MWSVSFTLTNTPFGGFLACVTSPRGVCADHLVLLVMEPNVFLVSVVKEYRNCVLTLSANG